MHLLTLAQAEFGMVQIALLALIVIIAVATPALVRIARMKRNSASTGGGDNNGDCLRLENRVRQTADKALVDLLEASREISAQIDMKIRMLNKLVKDADTESRRLEKLLGLCAQVKESPGKVIIKEPEPVKPQPHREELPLLHRQIGELSQAGKSPAEIARATRLSLHEVNLVLHLLTAKSER